MSRRDPADRADSTRPTAAVSRRKSTVLAVLRDREGPIDESRLATRVASRRFGRSPEAVTPDQRYRARIELTHTTLPRLADNGLVEWDRDRGAVSRQSDETTAPVDEAAKIRALAVDRRRETMAVLESRDRDGQSYVEVRTLAATIASRESDDDSAPHESTVQTIETSLHHVHLPMLADVGLVAYDPTTRLVTPTGGDLPASPDASDHWSALALTDD